MRLLWSVAHTTVLIELLINGKCIFLTKLQHPTPFYKLTTSLPSKIWVKLITINFSLMEVLGREIVLYCTEPFGAFFLIYWLHWMKEWSQWSDIYDMVLLSHYKSIDCCCVTYPLWNSSQCILKTFLNTHAQMAPLMPCKRRWGEGGG